MAKQTTDGSAENELNQKKEQIKATTKKQAVKKEGVKEHVNVPSKNVDLSSIVKFQTQFSKRVGDIDGDGDHDQHDEQIACCAASKLMITDAGFKTVNADKRIETGEFDDKLNVVPDKRLEEGLALLDKMLDEKKPVLIGVNRKKESVGNANRATSHFVVIVDRMYDHEGKVSYRFYDPGTSFLNKGTDPGQRFRLVDGMLKGTSKYCALQYIVTEVRPTLDK